MTVLLLVTVALASGVGDCQRTYKTPELLDAADSAEAAFASQDAERFETSRSALEARLACTTDALDASTVARVHRVEALAAFLEGRQDRVPQAIAGLFAAEPGHQLPPELIPTGHPIRNLATFAPMLLRDDAGVEIPKPGSGWVEVDTVYQQRVPSRRAAVLQQVDGNGAVVANHYHWPDEGGFSWMVSTPGGSAVAPAPVKVAAPASARAHTPSPWAHRAPLIGGAAVSLAASGVLLALAMDGRASFDSNPTLPEDVSDERRASYRAELEEIQGRTNLYNWTSYGTAALGLGLGVVAVVTW